MSIDATVAAHTLPNSLTRGSSTHEAAIATSERAYHPDFSSAEADAVLCSREGTLYRVPSIVLKMTSGFFRSVLALPPPKPSSEHPIPIAEPDQVITTLLKLMCGLEIAPWSSLSAIEDVLALAEVWETPGPISVIRTAITAPGLLVDPLRVFSIAQRFGWTAEAQTAARATLTLDLYDDAHQDTLQSLSANALMALLTLHRRRRDALKLLLDASDLFGAGNDETSACANCHTRKNNATWRELKARMFVEMDRRPLGDTLYGLEMEEWPESVACWNAKCTGCAKLNYDKATTKRNIQMCVLQLPDTV
ncbi:hypothetical protein BD626DRAFT_482922 [Schizophyllum amplum]|uniref:BTB domain-containing protein n=1 Tax=Schizophyllum amplum TaxID=97359 RepID=A0A550CNY2_9AGAR|nr:hypothetical protein BD626DRAFT_482922 [Auriculariopsis ampla]